MGDHITWTEGIGGSMFSAIGTGGDVDLQVQAGSAMIVAITAAEPPMSEIAWSMLAWLEGDTYQATEHLATSATCLRPYGASGQTEQTWFTGGTIAQCEDATKPSSGCFIQNLGLQAILAASLVDNCIGLRVEV